VKNDQAFGNRFNTPGWPPFRSILIGSVPKSLLRDSNRRGVFFKNGDFDGIDFFFQLSLKKPF